MTNCNANVVILLFYFTITYLKVGAESKYLCQGFTNKKWHTILCMTLSYAQKRENNLDKKAQ